jgi:ProP effector
MRDIVLGTRQTLVERFPKTFRGFGQPKLPLKIGIKADLFASPVVADLDRYAIGCALRDYCTGPTYHGSMVGGASRVDLEGNAVDIVNETAERYHTRQFAHVTHKRLLRNAARTAQREPKDVNLDLVTTETQILFVAPNADVSAIHQQNEPAT